MDLKSGACNNPNNIITVNAETITEVLRLFEYLKNKRRKNMNGMNFNSSSPIIENGRDISEIAVILSGETTSLPVK